MNPPNLISLGRIFLVPLTVWLIISGNTRGAFVVFVIAGISDAVDGYLAKQFGWQTELGAYLDPLADKLLLVSIFLALGYFGEIPSWLVIAVVSRDILIIAAFILSWMLARPLRVRPLAVSKLNTLTQIVLATVVLADSGFGLGWGLLRAVLSWSTGALTVLSALAYLRDWLRHMAGAEG